MLLDSDAPLRIRPRYAIRALPWLSRFVMHSTPKRVEQISFALSDLLSSSIQLYGDIMRRVSAQDLIRCMGQLQLYPDEASRASDASVWNLRRSRGVAVEEVSRDEIQQLEPAVGPLYGCGIYLPNEGMVTNPGRLIEVLAEYFLRNGGVFVRAHAVSFRGEGRRADAVITSDKGDIAADVVVVAAGAWSNELARQAGDDLPLQTQRGYHVTLSDPGVSITRPVVAADKKYFVSPMEIGIRVAGTVEFDSLAAPPNPARAAALARAVPELLPGIRVGKGSTWMGHRPCMPDSLPVIDRSTRFANVLYAFGNGHLGLTGAPKMAELVLALANDAATDIDVAPFRANRFKLWSDARAVPRDKPALG
jgi:D-amino-acid dehydrogenase